jgi:hypothetical protein
VKEIRRKFNARKFNEKRRNNRSRKNLSTKYGSNHSVRFSGLIYLIKIRFKITLIRLTEHQPRQTIIYNTIYNTIYNFLLLESVSFDLHLTST